MKQAQIVTAYNIINKLSDKKINLSTAFQIYKLKNKLKEYYDFQFEEEKKLLDLYNGIIDNGSLNFSNQEDANKFVEEMQKIADIEQDLEISPVLLSCSENIQLSVNEIKQLEGFIVFE